MYKPIAVAGATALCGGNGDGMISGTLRQGQAARSFNHSRRASFMRVCQP